MRNCTICNNELVGDYEHAVLFIDKTATDREICKECEQLLEKLAAADTAKEAEEIIGYFDNISKEMSDKEVVDYLGELLGHYTANFNDKAKKTRHSDDLSFSSPVSFWISIMRFFSWLILIGGITSGIFLSLSLFQSDRIGNGLLVIFISVVLSFLSVSGVMVFLNLAIDVSHMRKIMEKD